MRPIDYIILSLLSIILIIIVSPILKRNSNRLKEIGICIILAIGIILSLLVIIGLIILYLIFLERIIPKP